jgi:adenosine tuberculosinyltransferase
LLERDGYSPRVEGIPSSRGAKIFLNGGAHGAPPKSEWLRWSTAEVAEWVRSRPEPLVVGWPSNGTRRWYMAHRRETPDAGDYLSTIIRRQAEFHGMVLEHGVGVLLSPSFGAVNLERGAEYTRYALGGLLQIASDASYRKLFDGGVRLRFYGDYESVLDTPEYRPMLEACHGLMDATAAGAGPLVLIGLFVDSAHDRVARLGVEFARRNGRPPDRREQIEAYYGVPVPDLSLYVGYEQPQLFDVPLISTGLEDLYVTLNPTLDVTRRQLREILYDHLVARRTPPVNYESLPPEARESLIEYNERRRGMTLGLGDVDPTTGIWRPVIPEPHDTD